MKMNPSAIDSWLGTTFHSFPGLKDCISIITGDVLVIGAYVLDFYKSQSWIDLARKTGDIDLSIGITPQSQNYSIVKSELIKNGYNEDDEMKYRLRKPIKVGLDQTFAMIDLLVHPSEKDDEAEARDLMGVGEAWNFDGINFGLQARLALNDKISLPNPIGFIGLKIYSFSNEPKRVKDLVDIIDLIKRLVEKGIHYDLKDTWESMNTDPKAFEFVKKALLELEDPDSVKWDLGLARQEFYHRGYTEDDVNGELNDSIKQFNSAIGIS